MKSFIVSLFAIMVLFACSSTNQSAQVEETESQEEVAVTEKMTFPEDSVSEDGLKSYHGLRISEKNVVPMSSVTNLFANADMVSGATIHDVKMEGKVNAVCEKKGCWMTMAMDNGKEIRVTFKDYGFFVPKDIAGKNAVVEGVISMTTTSVEELRHYAVDGGMSEEEAEKKYTEPEEALAFEATGVIIKGE